MAAWCRRSAPDGSGADFGDQRLVACDDRRTQLRETRGRARMPGPSGPSCTAGTPSVSRPAPSLRNDRRSVNVASGYVSAAEAGGSTSEVDPLGIVVPHSAAAITDSCGLRVVAEVSGAARTGARSPRCTPGRRTSRHRRSPDRLRRAARALGTRTGPEGRPRRRADAVRPVRADLRQPVGEREARPRAIAPEDRGHVRAGKADARVQLRDLRIVPRAIFPMNMSAMTGPARWILFGEALHVERDGDRAQRRWHLDAALAGRGRSGRKRRVARTESFVRAVIWSMPPPLPIAP